MIVIIVLTWFLFLSCTFYFLCVWKVWISFYPLLLTTWLMARNSHFEWICLINWYWYWDDIGRWWLNPRPGRGGWCHLLRFFCDAPRTMRRIVPKFCIAYGASFAQLLVKQFWPGHVRSRVVRTNFMTPPPCPLTFWSRSGQSQGQGQVSDLGWPYDKFMCCLCL